MVVPGVPHHKTSLAKAIGQTDFVFAQYINEMFGRSGHFWQNRFFSCPLGPEHLWRALRYVDRNPVRTAIIRNAWEYRWSSAAAHTGMADSTGKLDWYWWERLSQSSDWRELLAGTESEADLTDLRQSTHCGRPLDSDAFIATSNSPMGRRLKPLPIGRPKRRWSSVMTQSSDETVPSDQERLIPCHNQIL